MKYKNPKICSKQQFNEYLVNGEIHKIIESLLAMALYSDDRAWIKKIVVEQISHESLEVRKASIVALSHIVRIDKNISYIELKTFLKLTDDEGLLSGKMKDLLDDWKIFNG